MSGKLRQPPQPPEGSMGPASPQYPPGKSAKDYWPSESFYDKFAMSVLPKLIEVNDNREYPHAYEYLVDIAYTMAARALETRKKYLSE